MHRLYLNKFRVSSQFELNEFISYILILGENYIRFLILKNRLFLPLNINAKDAAVDTLAEIFLVKENVLVKFSEFFSNNFKNLNFESDDEFEPYLRGFVYSVIQNNLPELYKNNDNSTYHIYRNLKIHLKKDDYNIEQRFSDKYISKTLKIDDGKPVVGKEDLIRIISTHRLGKEVMDINNFISKLFDILDNQNEFSNSIRLNDLVSVIKSYFVMDFLGSNGKESESEHISDRVNIKYILEDAKYIFAEKLNKYVNKNNLSKKFYECMYNIVDDIANELYAGNERPSVLTLMKEHFGEEDKTKFNKVQYCVEMFESEIAKNIILENK